MSADIFDDEPPAPGSWGSETEAELVAIVVEGDGTPDECTIHPFDGTDDELMTHWITASGDSFVSLPDAR